MWKNIYNYIPHRLFLNSALEKASIELKEKVSNIENEYAKNVKRVNNEIQEYINIKENEIIGVRESLIKKLNEYKDECDKMIGSCVEYINFFYENQKLLFLIDIQTKRKININKYCDIICNEINNIDDEIVQLNEMCKYFASKVDIDSIIKLMELNGNRVIIDTDSYDATISNINNLINKDPNNITLKKLKKILLNKNEYNSILKFINWLISDKKEVRNSLLHDLKILENDKRSIKNKKQKLINEKNKNSIKLDELKRIIICKHAKEIIDSRKKIHDIDENIKELIDENENKEKEKKKYESEKKYMKQIKSDDNYKWERLNRDIKLLNSDIDYNNGEIKEFEEKKLVIKEKMRTDYVNCFILNDIFAKYNVYLYNKYILDEYNNFIIFLKKLDDIYHKEENIAQNIKYNEIKEEIKIEKNEKNEVYDNEIKEINKEKNILLEKFKKNEIQVEKSKKNDDRNFIKKLFSESPEIIALKKKGDKIRTDIEKINRKINKIEKERDDSNSKLDGQLKKFLPIIYRPKEEEKKIINNINNEMDFIVKKFSRYLVKLYENKN